VWLLVLSLVCGLWTESSFANPMESLLKEQIAEQRYQDMRAKKSKGRKPRVSKKRVEKNVYKMPPHKIVLISGIGKKLVAHLTTGQGASSVIVRKGDRVHYDSSSYLVALISARSVVLKRGKHRYEIQFIAP
jgi:hypothetical protein